MATDSVPETYTCCVCGEVADARMTAECNNCSQRYHLNQRNDVEGKDCGQVWIDEQFLALLFACNNCLNGGPAAATSRPRTATRDPGRPRKYKRRA